MGKLMGEEINATVHDGRVVIELPVDILVFACENNPAIGYKVRDKETFARYIAKMIVDHDEDETGSSALHRLLDDLFQSAAEDDVIDIVEEDGNG